MSIYLKQLILAVIVVYIVDVSGFTQSWRGWLQAKLKLRELRPLPPFDCGLCMTWWACLLYPLFTGEFSLLTSLCAAGLSLLSVTIAAALLFIREWLLWIFNHLPI